MNCSLYKIIRKICNIDIEEVTLLTMDEALSLSDKILASDSTWWLCSRGLIKGNIAYVSDSGYVISDGCPMISYNGVRPVLKIKFNNEEFANDFTYDCRFRLADYDWIVLNNNTVICAQIIGFSQYMNSVKSDGDYKKSDVRKFLEEWAVMKGLIR